MNVKPEIKERIIAAAEALVAEGDDEPTNAAVLEKMGKGSLTHVSPVMREWRSSRKAEAHIALELPADLKKRIETALAQVWKEASQLAGAEIENIRNEALANVDAANAERDEALAEIKRLEEKIVQLENDVSVGDKTAKELEKRLESERKEVSKTAVENASLQARIEEKENQVKELKAELSGERKDNKKLQSELVEIAKTKKKE